MGNVIPFDGTVTDGEGMVNQASLTGESVAVRKSSGAGVFAGTVLEEGELTIQVTAIGGGSRYEQVVKMIEESEKLKSGLESKAEHLADRLVPWTLGGTALTYLLTRNVTRTLSVLMVDFSCALKMAMPISVLYAIHEAETHHITVKGGKFLEAVAEAEVKTNCCVSQHVWKNTSHILWQKLWYMRHRKEDWSMKRCIPG